MLALPTVPNLSMALSAHYDCHAKLFLLTCDATDAIVGLAPDAGSKVMHAIDRIMHPIVGLAPDAGSRNMHSIVESMSQNRQIWQNM